MMNALTMGKLDVRMYAKGAVSVIKSASHRGSGIVTIGHSSLGGIRHENLRPDLASPRGGLLGPSEDGDKALFGLESKLRDPPPRPEKGPRHLDKFPPDRLLGEPLGLNTAVCTHNVCLALHGPSLQV